MLTLTDEARFKIRQRLDAYCDSEMKCEGCIFANEFCNFGFAEDAELLKCYHKWLDMIIHENLLGDEE